MPEDETFEEPDIGAPMPVQEEEEPFIDDKHYNWQGIHNLKSSGLIPTQKNPSPLNGGARHSSAIPKYIIREAEKMIEEHYNPVAVSISSTEKPVEATPIEAPATQELTPKEKAELAFKERLEAEAKITEEERRAAEAIRNAVKRTRPRFAGRDSDSTEEQEPTMKKTFQRNGQKVTMEEIPLAAPEPKIEITKTIETPTVEVQPTIQRPQPTAIPPEDKLMRMADEIKRLKEEQANLERERKQKLELLKLKLNTIPAKIKAKHPVLSLLAKEGSKTAFNAGVSLAKGLGNVAVKAAKAAVNTANNPNELIGSLDRITNNFVPEGYQQNPIDRINGIRYTAPTPQPQPARLTNNELEKEAERIRLERNIIRNRMVLKNQIALAKGEKPPYPDLYVRHPQTRTHKKTVEELEEELEKARIENALKKERKLAVA